MERGSGSDNVGSTHGESPVRVMVPDLIDLQWIGLVALLEKDNAVEVTQALTHVGSMVDSVRREKPDVILLPLTLLGTPISEQASRLHDATPAAKLIAVAEEFDPVVCPLFAGQNLPGYWIWGDLTPEFAHASLLAIHAGACQLSPGVLAALAQTLAERRASAIERFALTDREAYVLDELVRGTSQVDIAGELGLADRTIGWDVEHLRAKLGAATTPELIAHGVRHGFGSP